MNYTTRILLIYLLVVVALCLAASCNPVKKVLKDTAKMQEVFNKGVELGWCVNDSVYVSDTTIQFDTIYSEAMPEINYLPDTSFGKATPIEYLPYTEGKPIIKMIVKTITIRDTTVVTDNSRVNLLQKEVIKKDGEAISLNNKLVDSKAETKEARKQRNDWRLRTWILGIAFIVWLLRKPIMKLIKPI